MQEESDLSSDAHPAQGLADASAQLMQSLDNLLGSLEVPTQDTPDHAALQQQQQEQQQQRDDDHEWVANQQRLQADAEPEVELLGRASPAEEGECLGNDDHLWTSQNKPDRPLLIQFCKAT